MNDNKYNGWANYATWRIQLEIISDYVDAEMQRIQDGDTELLNMSVGELADYLKEYVESMLEDGLNEPADQSMVLGYAFAFLDEVNWYELAEHAQEDWQHELNHIKESK